MRLMTVFAADDKGADRRRSGPYSLETPVLTEARAHEGCPGAPTAVCATRMWCARLGLFCGEGELDC